MSPSCRRARTPIRSSGQHGRDGYGERLRQSQPYLEYLLDRAAAGHNLNTDEGRVQFLSRDAADCRPDSRSRRCGTGSRTGWRIKARVTDDVVRAEIRKGGGHRSRPRCREREMPSFGQVTKAEKGLIWWLVHDPSPALAALASLEPADFEGLAARFGAGSRAETERR